MRFVAAPHHHCIFSREIRGGRFHPAVAASSLGKQLGSESLAMERLPANGVSKEGPGRGNFVWDALGRSWIWFAAHPTYPTQEGRPTVEHRFSST